MFRPPKPLRELVPGPSGVLETLIEAPDGPSPTAFAVVCHPHPLQGGTMDNKVVHTLARALNEVGLATLRFNYRGVGKSEGTYDEGRGETDDALAMAAFGAARWPGASLWLAGFSFGGFVAVNASHRLDPERVVAVSPAVSRFAPTDAAGPRCPWLVVQGDADDVIAPEAVLEWARKQVPVPEIAVFPGASHFFHGRLTELREAVVAFAAQAGRTPV